MKKGTEIEIELPASALRGAGALAVIGVFLVLATGVVGWLHTDHDPRGRALVLTWDRLHARRYVASAREHLRVLTMIHADLVRLSAPNALPGGSERIAPMSTIEAGRPTPTPFMLPDPRPVPLLERVRQISVLMGRLRALSADIEATRPPEALSRTHTLIEDALKAQVRFAAALADWSALPSPESERALRAAREEAAAALERARAVFDGL